jgi:hypothetical protein
MIPMAGIGMTGMRIEIGIGSREVMIEIDRGRGMIRGIGIDVIVETDRGIDTIPETDLEVHHEIELHHLPRQLLHPQLRLHLFLPHRLLRFPKPPLHLLPPT